MSELEELLDEMYAGSERISRDEIHRRAVAADLPVAELAALDALPEGEYGQSEVVEAIGPRAVDGAGALASYVDEGVPAERLDDDELIRELESLHRTRHDTFLHGSGQALQRHTQRSADLELEYLRRFPQREVTPERLRSGARLRAGLS
jgi:hypothetical protein